jgi:hypothetical protein
VNEKNLRLCLFVFVLAVVLTNAALTYRTGRSADRSAELRVEAEAEYRRLKSDFNRAAATIDEVERGLGTIGSIAAEMRSDNEGAVGAIRTAIEIVERVRVEVAAMERCISDFRNNNDTEHGTDYNAMEN